ncbi:putative L-aspartate dehydrogenase [Hypsibius exemplaris]|uniref:Aspartate dehydrogenase domain-containing protein n=1 Tax=Hypsibius exemplaris TaxID=2072580 RepID=A0A1W0X407_HYPEX|nr:putative L-aspartate dehydrogenase [Hypsibius exemplaris]
MVKRKIGLVGFGHVGQYLYEFITSRDNLEIAFVWNRTRSVLEDAAVPKHLILESLEDFESHTLNRKCDLIIEVAHPSITKTYGMRFLKHADYMIGSPTALADEDVETGLRELATEGAHGLYIPVGALWGAEDIRRLADAGTLHSLCITMTKHPAAFRLSGRLDELNQTAVESQTATVLYDGGIRALCGLAPNNVNTMAAAAVAAHNLGFDKVRGRLIADPAAEGWHIIRVEATGSKLTNGTQLSVVTERRNPAETGAVTGSATYASFASSVLSAHGKGPGFHIC